MITKFKSVFAVIAAVITVIAAIAFLGAPTSIGSQGQSKSTEPLHLYDGRDQDLGIMVGKTETGFYVYNPALDAITEFRTDQPTPRADLQIYIPTRPVNFYYENPNCQETPTVLPDAQIMSVIRFPMEGVDRYFKVDQNTGRQRLIRSSRHSYPPDSCETFVSSRVMQTFETEEVELPFIRPIVPLQFR